MKVQFVKKTHYFFSVGRDFLVKYWDADTFQLILSLFWSFSRLVC